MISLIICSRKSDIPTELCQNISETIGCEYELVIIDNSDNRYSIFSAYNEGIRRSEGEILCFCHDDILFRSAQWGNAVTALFEDGSIGLIGVGGSHFMSSSPIYWSSLPFISQFGITTDKGIVTKDDYRHFFHGHLADVVAVDGVCFFIPKDLFETIRFDDKTYTGFHAYDMDISMLVQSLGKRVCVTDVLTVEHFWSEDSMKNPYYIEKLDTNMNLFCRKWKEKLPIVRGLDEPEIVIKRLNILCILAYDSTKVRRSNAYRLGHILLKPFKLFKLLMIK